MEQSKVSPFGFFISVKIYLTFIFLDFQKY